jgi:DHA1 family tetracycline resistance protein-like MFS transporter
MKKHLVLAIMLFTIFLDIFNLGLIYPIFTSLVFEGNGNLISVHSSEFYKNAIFGLMISLFPFGQFLGAPLIGQLSDYHGRRKLLMITLIGTAVTLLVCACGVLISSLLVLCLGRFIGGLMAGNMTLAYASLADFSSEEEKVKNFALIPLATGLGFALGPYLAGMLANPESHPIIGLALPFLLATLLCGLNFCLVYWKFPETFIPKTGEIKIFNGMMLKMVNLGKAFREPALRAYLIVLFLMISANLVFIQFIGPFAIDRFHIGVTEVGYLYANIGISVSLGHLFLTRRLADSFSSEQALMWSLFVLGALLMGLPFSNHLMTLHILTFFIMLACAVAYTNSMALVSNQATKERQGEAMGVAVSVQSCSEFLPALTLSLIAAFSQAIPLIVAALFAFFSHLLLISLEKKKEVTSP